LETRLLVRDQNATVYGVTYKWRPDNSDADLLTSSLSEPILITNANLTISTQTWYYPSPTDCMTCHTPAANYVLGVKTRQLDSLFTYPSTSQADYQLRTLNRLGLFNPAFNETNIATYTHLVEVTNAGFPLVDRARSYIDANCAHCHRPGGSGPGFDARWDTPLASQSIIYGPLTKGDLGNDHAYVVVPKDIWRSILYQRAHSVDPAVKMPPLARNLVDTNSLDVVAAWINSLPGTPALPPPNIVPSGGTFSGPISVTLQPPITGATLYYTTNGSLPDTTSAVYSSPIPVTNSLTLKANAFAPGYTNSVAANGVFVILPGVVFTTPGFLTNGNFQLQIAGPTGKSYVLQASTNLVNWTPITTNVPASTPFSLVDSNAPSFSRRFYRVMLLP
jgi:mono/diheme cytochrome c family protein